LHATGNGSVKDDSQQILRLREIRPPVLEMIALVTAVDWD